MPEKLTVLLDPHFRTLDQVFASEDLERLHGVSNVLWGKDNPIPQSDLGAIRDKVQIIITGRWRHGEVSGYPRLRAIMEIGGKHPAAEIIDYRYCFANGIHVLSCAPAFAPMVAEMAMGLAISACRNVSKMDRAFRAGTEEYQFAGNVGAMTLYNAKIGLVGHGNLAKSLIPLLAPFTRDISAYDPWLPDSLLRRNGITPSTLADLLRSSDVVFVLAIPTGENQGMLSRELLEKIRSGAVLVLMSRAHVVDFDALVELVAAGRFRLATDVYPKEPVPKKAEIRRLADAVLTPHIAESVREDIRTIGRWVVDDLEAISMGIPPQALQPARMEMISKQ